MESLKMVQTHDTYRREFGCVAIIDSRGRRGSDWRGDVRHGHRCSSRIGVSAAAATGGQGRAK
jgi:hypothetical protein